MVRILMVDSSEFPNQYAVTKFGKPLKQHKSFDFGMQRTIAAWKADVISFKRKNS